MLLISTEQLLSSKYSELIALQCDNCKQIFRREQRFVKRNLLKKQTKYTFCSNKCMGEAKITKIQVECKQCKKVFLKVANQLKKHPNSFCNLSCAAKYNNTHKTKGTRRSKFEIYLSEILPNRYSDLEFHFNRIDAINSELDIYIPSLKLAFELNGIFHYEPIYGKEKLEKTQNNDKRKFQACLEQNIELCIIDVSSITYFKPNRVQKFVDIITNIIDSKYKRTE